jgi:two-component system chemotaxis sensor kinase CheA
LSARQSGGEVLIAIQDNGRGINRERVRAKAEAQGLIAPGQVVGDQELFQMIFHPGFSTAAAITNLSGPRRGHGCGQAQHRRLRGTIDIESRGRRHTMTLHLPLTLAIIECMSARGRRTLCDPLSVRRNARTARRRSGIERAAQLPRHSRRSGPYLRLRDSFNTDHPADLFQKVVIVGQGRGRVGLVVDQIIGNTQTVIKGSSSFHAGLGSHATILGDGTVALILDVGHLVAGPSHQRALGATSSGEAA